MGETLGLYICYDGFYWCRANVDERILYDMNSVQFNHNIKRNNYNLSKEIREQKFKKTLGKLVDLEKLEGYKDISAQEKYKIRVLALDRLLKDEDFIGILMIFLSNRGSSIEYSNEENNIEKYRTYGEYVYKEKVFSGDMKVSRKYITKEIETIFTSQKLFGNKLANDKNKQIFFSIFNYDFSNNDEKKIRHKVRDFAVVNKKNDYGYITHEEIKDSVVYTAVNTIIRFINTAVENFNITNINFYIDSCEEKGSSLNDNLSAEEKIELEKYYFDKYGKKAKSDQILILKLFKDQNGVCQYSGEVLDKEKIFTEGYVEVDHVIPKSRSNNNSFYNKLLVKFNENRNKGNKTPYEYLTAKRWDKFKEWVEGSNLPEAKKKLLLSKDEVFENENSFNITQKGLIISKLKNILMSDLNNDKQKNIYFLKDDDYLKRFKETNYVSTIFSEKEELFDCFSLIFIYDELKPLLSVKEKTARVNIEIDLYIKYSLWKGCIEIFKDKITNIGKIKSPMVLRKKLKELTKEDLKYIKKTGMNKDLLKYIELRLDQFDYDAEKAFEEDVYLPSKNGNGTVIKSVTLVYF